MNLETFSKLITNSTEIVMVVMAFFAALFAGIQAFLLFKGFELASNFDIEHKRKLKIDKDFELTKEIVFKVNLLCSIADGFFQKVYRNDINDFLNSSQREKLHSKLSHEHGKLLLINNRVLESSKDYLNCLSELETATIFLKDPLASGFFQEFRDSYYQLILLPSVLLNKFKNEEFEHDYKTEREKDYYFGYGKQYQTPFSSTDTNFEQSKKLKSAKIKFINFLVDKKLP